MKNNRSLLVKHGVITEDSNEYIYIMDFIQLEVDLNIHATNITNNEVEFKKAV